MLQPGLCSDRNQNLLNLWGLGCLSCVTCADFRHQILETRVALQRRPVWIVFEAGLIFIAQGNGASQPLESLGFHSFERIDGGYRISNIRVDFGISYDRAV